MICEFCGRQVTASEDMEYWFCLSEVKGGEETFEIYLCSQRCLRDYVNEDPTIQFDRKTQQLSDGTWVHEETRSGRLKDQ